MGKIARSEKSLHDNTWKDAFEFRLNHGMHPKAKGYLFQMMDIFSREKYWTAQSKFRGGTKRNYAHRETLIIFEANKLLEKNRTCLWRMIWEWKLKKMAKGKEIFA